MPRHLPKEPGPVECPFCMQKQRSQQAEVVEDEGEEGARRHKRRQKKERQDNKIGLWWKKYGYVGKPYCQRCSELFRDHIICQLSNSAHCTREKPCADCEAVLRCFKKPIDWQRLDVAGKSRRQPRERKLAPNLDILRHPDSAGEFTAWAGHSMMGVPGAMHPGQYDRASYIRNLGDVAQAQKRQALDLLSQSEWASALQEKVRQEDTAHGAAQHLQHHRHHLQHPQQQLVGQQFISYAAAPFAASSQQVVPMVGPGGQIIHVLVPHHDGGAVYNGGNTYMYAAVGNPYAQHVLIPAHAGAHAGRAPVAFVDTHGNAVATGGAGVSMAAAHQMHAVPMMGHPAQQQVIMSGPAAIQIGQEGGVVYHGGLAGDATGTQTLIVGAPPSGNVLVPVKPHGDAQRPQEAQAWPVVLSSSSHPAD